MLDERLSRLEIRDAGDQFEGNAFSDGIVGMLWGTVGACGVVVALAGALGSLEIADRGVSALAGVVGWAIASVAVSLFAGIGIGAVCGFVAGWCAHFTRGVAARAVAGVVGAEVCIVATIAAAFEGDLSVVFADGVGTPAIAAAVVAAGAGLMAGINSGREIGV
jgi:hypothetical protein